MYVFILKVDAIFKIQYLKNYTLHFLLIYRSGNGSYQ